MLTPESTHDNITEEELNQALLNFLKNITTQENHQQQQGLNNQLNDPNFFLYNNVLQKITARATAPPTTVQLSSFLKKIKEKKRN